MESCSKCNFNCQPYGGCKSLNLIQKRTGCFFETVRKSLKRAENRLLLTCHSTTVIYKTRVRSLIYLQLGLFFQLIYFSQVHMLSTTIYLWLISLTASKELSILLLKLYNDGAIGISNTFLDSASVIKTDNQLLIRSVRFMQVESP